MKSSFLDYLYFLRRRFGVIAFVVATAVATPSRAAPTASLERRLDAALTLIDRELAKDSVAGAVIAVSDRTSLLRVHAYGYRDLKTKTPITSDTRFPIGSISKSFTAFTTMALAEQGRIDIRAPVATYLPSLSSSSFYKSISTHDLLTHGSGLPGYRADLASSEALLEAYADYRAPYEPQKHWWYSNIGYQIIGYVLERAARELFTNVIKNQVLDPLEMTSTSAVIDNQQQDLLPKSYISRLDHKGMLESPWFEYAAADGCIVSTASDMSSYARMILNRGVGPRGPVISAASFDEIIKPVARTHDELSASIDVPDYGYGLIVREIAGDTVVSHPGSIMGFNNLLEVHMNDHFSLVLLTNGGMDYVHEDWISSVITNAFRGVPAPAPPEHIGTAELENYAGIYRSDAGDELKVSEMKTGLVIRSKWGAVSVTRAGIDSFRSDPRSSNEFPFFFAGKTSIAPATGVSHGAEWFARAGGLRHPVSGSSDFRAFVGHYSDRIPEMPDVRIFVRDGHLMTAYGGSEGTHDAVELEMIAEDTFREKGPVFSPEFLRFRRGVDRTAQSVEVSGVPMYRIPTQ